MKVSRKLYWLFYFFISLPIGILGFFGIRVGNFLYRNNTQPVLSYSAIKPGEYSLHDYVTGTGIGILEVSQIVPDDEMVVNVIGEQVSGYDPMFSESSELGKYEFSELELTDCKLYMEEFKDETYWVGPYGQNYAVIINMIEDKLRRPVPEAIQGEKRTYYLFTLIDSDALKILKSEGSGNSVRKKLLSSRYESQYSGIFYASSE
ncbi:hypothetical protein K7I13_11470 [Brucepastera parasyntrophica]|uniref:hypothetical protein n=1 Tax=Brucepastera parasyntrophica TaxID=2880008 RepID=UPI0021087A17|nr:hypothetical protein [Brucepastera parasyntrophica]ULQ59119.1 hypothetical protein K7I13_11470 [Brucepastera parasyntrophica]